MWKSHGSRIALACAVVALGLASHDLDGQAAEDGLDVSTLTASAAVEADPLAFASALASERVPAGIVLVRDHLPTPSSRRAAPSGARVPLRDAVARFLQAHPDFSERTTAGAIVLRPKGPTACDAALRARPVPAERSGKAFEVFWHLARAVNPARVPAAPPGVVCAGQCGDVADRGYAAQVTLSNGEATLEDSLSAVSAQARLVWIANDTRVPFGTGMRKGAAPRVCRLSYLDGDQYVQTSYDLLADK